MGHFDEVEVLNTFTGKWTPGFEVSDLSADGSDRFLVRRQSDGTELPTPIAASRIRAAHSARDE